MKGWRTIAFNCVAAVITVLQAADWSWLPAKYQWVTLAVTIGGNGILRLVTDTPVGKPQ